MINEQYIKSSIDSFDESSQEEAFCQIFNPVLEPMDINDEINHDKLYFVYYDDTNDGKDNPTWKLVEMKSVSNE